MTFKKSKNSYTHKSISDDQSEELKLIGQTIRELRFNFGMITQKRLSELSDVHFNTIQAIEGGDKNYNILSLMKIISTFNLDFSKFFKI